MMFVVCWCWIPVFWLFSWRWLFKGDGFGPVWGAGCLLFSMAPGVLFWFAFALGHEKVWRGFWFYCGRSLDIPRTCIA